ncbi:hypothetical protein [Dokdonella sp.]|uniref:hypothetical protein n=1 Tax=Dokdonella sp. TaxID=2291710 RepID=UPI00322070AC
MLQPRQQACLAQEARRIIHALAQQLHRNLLLEASIGTFAQPDLAHAAAPDAANQRPCASTMSFEFACRCGRGFEKTFGSRNRTQQFQHFGTDRRIGLLREQEGFAFDLRLFQCRIEQSLDAGKTCRVNRIHRARLPPARGTARPAP